MQTESGLLREEDTMTYEIEVRELQPQPVVAVRVSVPVEAIPTVMGEIFDELFAYVGRAGLIPAGMPYARYHSFGAEEVDMEVGAPLATPAQGEGRVVSGELPGGPVAATLHVGPYDGIAAAYDAIAAWMHERGSDPAGAPWEAYCTDPSEVADPAEYRTEVFWPIR
jgi:effector-binding domain-containing protein